MLVAETFIVRIFRVLTAAKLVDEVGEARYRANAKTVHAVEPGTRAGLAHWFDNMAPVFVDMPGYFKERGYSEPQEQKHGPYHHVFNQTYWDRLQQNPDLAAYLNTYMTAHKKSGTSIADLYPKDKLIAGFDSGVCDVLLVDVGGGKGHQLHDLSTRYGKLPGKLVLQDQPSVLPETDDAVDFTPMPHNFFDVQPVRGARYYYLSAILHDWPDEACQVILQQTAWAMVPGYSKILINGIILPSTKASLFEACKDFGMMAAMSAKERTLRQIEELASASGLRVGQVFLGPRGRDSILELERPVAAFAASLPPWTSSSSRKDSEAAVKDSGNSLE